LREERHGRKGRWNVRIAARAGWGLTFRIAFASLRASSSRFADPSCSSAGSSAGSRLACLLARACALSASRRSRFFPPIACGTLLRGLARRRLLYNGPGTPTPSQQWEGASGRFGTISNVVENNHVGILSGWFLNDIVGEGKCRTQRIMHMLHPRLLGFTGSTFGKYSPERDHTR
jgi:hypothetical protein